MRDANPIRTLGDDSKPSHEGYRNTIELPIGKNVVPLRSNTIRLVQNGCSFHELRSKDPNQHLKDFLKLMDSLDLDGENRERTRLRLFQFSLRYQARNWLERLPAGPITTWKDLTTRFLAQFFPSGRTAKLRNDILIFQQHHRESISEAWTRFKDLLQKVPHHGIDRWLQIQIFYDHVSFHLKCEIDRAAGGKSAIRTLTNIGISLRTSPFTTMRDEITSSTGLHSLTHRKDGKILECHFKQREEINDRMEEMFRVLKELTTSRAPEKVLIREEAKSPITKNVNSISLARGEEERNDDNDVATGDNIKKPTGTEMGMPVKEAKKENEAENGIKNEPIRKARKEKMIEAPNSQPVEYYLKHMINRKLIEGLIDNHRYNDSLSGARVGKIKGKTDNLLPRGLIYETILIKKVTRNEDIGGNFKIPCNIGGLKHMNALVDQGSDVNVMPLSTYMKLTDERPTKTDIILSLASHSYIYPLGIVEDVLVEVAEHVYPIDFMILDIKEDEKRPFILGTQFLTMAKAVIKFDKGTITLRSGKSNISFHRNLNPFVRARKGLRMI
ncbi:MAK10-like protein [Tanacetum coccineum]